ncbi:hypothetical protein AGMMS49965_22850 [Bacteroidia bacterium]|nr:hypothetical protein AGMMS49965_22850 [Bacteroidia bacterium]
MLNINATAVMDIKDFISKELEKRKRDYLESPASIIEHYNIEQSNIQSYNGRQLLELLQNADDASETAKEKKVLIRLQDNTLIIANNGEAFSEKGFESILYSNLSPKAMQQNKIGQKGLGFRSILSWAEKTEIISGNVKVGFSEEIAKNFLSELITNTPNLQTEITKRSKAKYPIAVLRVPKLEDVNDEEKQGFDTVISLILKDDIIDEVQTQISTKITKETLVFLNHIEEIEIDSPVQKCLFRKTNVDNQITVFFEDSLNDIQESKTWTFNKIQGKHNDKNYELAVAWNDNLDDTENVLFTYFKTKVNFPFPALLHGTFELTPDRNNLVNDTDGHNKFLAEKLAELLIHSALKIASQDENATYKPLKLLNIDFDSIDGVLKEFNFKNILIEEIKASKIFPTVNGNYISHAEKPVYYDYPIADFLNGEDVNNLLVHSKEEELTTFVQSIGTYYYILTRYFNIAYERRNNFEQLAKLIFNALTYERYKKDLNNIENLPEILTNAGGNSIPWNAEIFILSENDTIFKLPKILNIRFVAPELVQKLSEVFQTEKTDDLISKLDPFNIKQYDFSEISRLLIKHYSDKKTTKDKVLELHTYLFKLYKNETKSHSKPDKLDNINIPIITHKQKIEYADKVYFGKSYENDLAEKLYNYDKNKLLADKSVFKLEKEKDEKIIDYFQWLGVAKLPRYELKIIDDYDVKQAYEEYLKVNNVYVEYPEIKIGNFDGIENILLKTSIDSILHWIEQEKLFKETLEKNKEILSGACINNSGPNGGWRQGVSGKDILSYTKWLISTTKFLPVISDSGKAEPDKCCLSKTITKDFAPFVEIPKIDKSTLSEKLKISEETIETYLTYLGVHREIKTFSVDNLYKMLASLPNSDKEGKIATKIYREIIHNYYDEKKFDDTNSNYQNFIKQGQILCEKSGKRDYYPVSQSFYIDKKTYSKNVLSRFPLVCIDKKRGKEKVFRLFGIKALENISFKTIETPTQHTLNPVFIEEINRFKALVYALRIRQDTKFEIKNRLKKLKINICQKIDAKFIHGENEEAFDCANFEYINTNVHSFFIFVPDTISSLNDLREENTFCDSISDIFTSIIGVEEYRSFILDLYSKQEIHRESRLLHELEEESNEIIEDSKSALDIIDDVRLSFWRAFSLSLPKKSNTDIRNEKELSAFFQKIKLDGETVSKFSETNFFTQLSDIDNQEIIYKLFIDYKIDYEKFTLHFSGLNFTKYYNNEIEDLKRKFKKEFEILMFQQYQSKSVFDKIKYFSYIEEYEYIEYENTNIFHINIEQYFIKLICDKFYIELKGENIPKPIETIIDENKKSFDSIPASLIENKEIQALLLFNEKDEIEKRIKKYNAVKTENETYKRRTDGSTDWQALANSTKDIDFSKIRIEECKSSSVENLSSNNNKFQNHSNQRNVQFNTKNNEQIGFIAEHKVYLKLCDKYGEDNVNWISENAYRAYPEKFITREAGKGFDMELTDKNGKVRFIEMVLLGIVWKEH